MTNYLLNGSAMIMNRRHLEEINELECILVG